MDEAAFARASNRTQIGYDRKHRTSRPSLRSRGLPSTETTSVGVSRSTLEQQFDQEREQLSMQDARHLRWPGPLYPVSRTVSERAAIWSTMVVIRTNVELVPMSACRESDSSARKGRRFDSCQACQQSLEERPAAML